jgi:hypothetical protein
MKTIRRDRLRRLVEADRVEVVGSYHFDDMTGTERHRAAGMRAAIMPAADRREMQPGVCYLLPGDFTSQVGRAWVNDNGTVTLYVHSNSNPRVRRPGTPSTLPADTADGEAVPA